MALTQSRRQRTLLLCALYFAQGAPRGFMTITLISYLTGRGVADSVAGRLSAFIAIPWALKFVWAPLIDSVAVPSMGRRRPWIICAELMMAVTLLGFLILYDPTRDITLIGWLFFAHNCFAALQDVLSDALAIDVLPEEELGPTNGLMMASKMVGIGAGASGLAVIMQYWGMQAAVVAQFLLLISIMLLPIFILERPGDRLFPWSRDGAVGERVKRLTASPRRVLQDLKRAFSVKAIMALTALGCLASVSEWIIEVINKSFYTKVLGWTFVKFSAVSGVLLVLQFLAALAGGWSARRFGLRPSIIMGLGTYGLSALVFGLFNPLLIQTWFPVLFLFLPPAANAFGSVAFYSTAMRVSWTRSAATVFTSMMAIASLGHVVGGWLIGPLREGLGLSYPSIYCLGGALMLAPLLLLLAVDHKRMDEMNLEEAPAAVADVAV